MTAVLGVSAFYHDSAACLLVDGVMGAAAQEERFSRCKHDAAFPTQAIDYCLREAGCTVNDLDYVAFYEKPLSKLDRLLETYLAFAPDGLAGFNQAIPTWLKEKSHLPARIRSRLGLPKTTPVVFLSHHESHAASAFFPSPFDEAAILTLDGVGEWTTTAMGTGKGHHLQLTRHIQFPHSLGLLYSAFTHYCGFRVNSGEYKLMGLAPFGQPVYRELILTHLIDLRPDGSFWLDMRYFNYCQGLTMTNRRFEALFGGPARTPEAAIEQRHMDLAASVQAVAEEAVLAMGRELHRQTGQSYLVMAGGVALNCVANGRLLREGPFDDVWVQPAAGDAGGALGAAWFVWHQLLEHPRAAHGMDAQQASLLGPGFVSEEIRATLDRAGHTYHWVPDEDELIALVAEALSKEQIVGWFQGRMEFGPRALGARSILGDARSSDMQATMNLKVKFRESFRPFAPIVLRDKASEWFDLEPDQESPYMMIVAPVAASKRVAVPPALTAQATTAADLRQRLSIPRSVIPAVTHVDGTARVQTVDASRHPRLAHLLRAFDAMTGCPVLVNTSFNVRGEPIVCTPEDALRCFLATDIDVLVMEDVVLFKQDMSTSDTNDRRAAHVSQFSLD